MPAKPSAADLRLITSLIARGCSLREVGAILGLTRQAIHARLVTAGFSIGALRPTACIACGRSLSAARRRPGSRSLCHEPACRRAADREARALANGTRLRARCSHCGKELRHFASPAPGPHQEPPRFCTAPACAAAYIRWRRSDGVPHTKILRRAA